MPGLQLGFSIATLFVVILVCGAAALAFSFYRTTVPPVSPPKRLLLSLLRASSLALLCILLAEPLLTLTRSTTQRPVLAILMDNSRSMRITDRTTDRRAALGTVLHSDALRAVARRADLRFFTFGASLREVSSPVDDTLSLDEETTDISSALRSLRSEMQKGRIDAAVLLSDGSYNIGQNPVYDAEQISIPVYAVGIGDSAEQKDLLVSRVLANDVVYSGAATPVDVTIRSSGFGGERVEVTLLDGTREVDRASLALGPGTRDYSVPLSYTPEGTGRRKYVARVSTLSGELTTENNQRAFFPRVLKSKLQVAIVAGIPSPDLSIIRQSLMEEKNFAVRSYCQRFPTGFYDQIPSQAVLDSADCLVFVGFPSPNTDAATLLLVSDALAHRQKPLLFILGRNIDYRLIEPFRGVLPFTVEIPSPAERLVSFVPADAQRGNPLLHAGVDGGFDVWRQLPPVFSTITAFHAKPGTTVLGFAAQQGVTLPDPFILTRSLNRQKSLAILGYGIWRWRLMSQTSAPTTGFFSSFLAACVQWLTAPEANRPVRVVTSKEVYTRGEPVDFTAQIYDAASNPVQNARAHVVVRQGEKRYETDLRPVGNGRYEGSLAGLDEGDIDYRGTAESDSSILGEDTGRFTVGPVNLESQETRMNAPILRELAWRTHGRFFLPATMDSLTTALLSNPSFAASTLVKAHTIELWTWPYLLALLIALLGTEWYVRKRSGMQ